MLTNIVDMLINLIRDNYNIWIFCQHLSHLLQLLSSINTSGRVRWRAKNQRFSIRSNSLLQLLCSNLKILINSGIYKHRFTLSQLHHFRVAHPVSSRDNNLIILTNDREYNRSEERRVGKGWRTV